MKLIDLLRRTFEGVGGLWQEQKGDESTDEPIKRKSGDLTTSEYNLDP